MEAGTSASRILRFGPFALDVRTGELFRAGLKAPIQLQPSRVLALLAQRPGELVTRDDLQHLLWPDDVFVDVEHGLNVVIAKLRRALGDSIELPHYIETLERRGYRFLAPVEVAEGHVLPRPSRSVHVTVGDAIVSLGEGVHHVGRDPRSAVQIDSATVSRRHASLSVAPREVVLADLGSRNGTFVNGRRITEPTNVLDGDEIRVGTVRLALRSDVATHSTAAESPTARDDE